MKIITLVPLILATFAPLGFPHLFTLSAAIFQAKNNGAPNWAVQLTMNSKGDVIFSPRHKMPHPLNRLVINGLQR